MLQKEESKVDKSLPTPYRNSKPKLDCFNSWANIRITGKPIGENTFPDRYKKLKCLNLTDGDRVPKHPQENIKPILKQRFI